MQKLIKQIRTYLNTSQTEFAEQLNVTFQTVNRWENGRAVPNKLAQLKIFDLCREKHVPEPKAMRLWQRFLYGNRSRSGTHFDL